MEEKILVKKLAKVMQEVKYIQKTGYNTFHKYKYATEADVNEKVREELAKQNIIMLPSVLGHEMRTHTNRSGATEYITCVDMQFTFIDGDSGESFTINMSGEGQDAGDKGIYKAIAGAQKYALMKAFMIPTGDDPEADEGVDERNHDNKSTPPQRPQTTPPQANKSAGQPQAPADPNKASEAQLKAIFAIGKKANVGEDYIKSQYNIQSMKDLTKKQASEIIEELQQAAV